MSTLPTGLVISIAILVAWLLYFEGSSAAAPTVTIAPDARTPAAPKPRVATVTLGEGTVTPSDPSVSCGPGCYYTTDPTDAEAP